MRVRVLHLVLLLASTSPAFSQPKAKEPRGHDVFGQTKVWQFGLSLSAKEYEAMQPIGGGFFGQPGGGFGQPQPKQPMPKADPNRDSHRSTFGMEFPVAKGEFTADGKTYKDVGIRYKGNGSYLPTAGKAKRNFKVELDKFNDAQRFRGLKTINLNAGGADPTKIREAIAYGIYRDCGVVAPRTAFAEVSISVEGKWDKENLGLFTFVEQVDRAFLKEHFKDGKGLLLKPERMRTLDYLGDDWERYKANYNPKGSGEPTKEQTQRAIEFIKLINQGDDASFNKQIGSYLDIDRFLRFMAVTAMLANMDSFCSLGHNFYLYLNPTDNKFVFIPWDVDLALAGFPFMFTPEVQLDLSLTHPYSGEYKLIDRLFSMKDIESKYQAVVKELSATVFTKERILKDVETIEDVTKEIIAKETKTTAARKEPAGFDMAAFGGRATTLRDFADKRLKSISDQLAGKSKGQIPPAMGFGAPRPNPPRPGDVIPQPIQDQLRLSADQKRKLAEIQKGVDKQLQELMTEEQRAQWKRIREAAPPGGPGFPPKGGKQ